MPNIGEVIDGKKIGYKGSGLVLWVACVDCGKERWVRFVKDKPISRRCASCAHKLIQQEVKQGIRLKPIFTKEGRRSNSLSKLGKKNPNYGKHGSLNSAWRGGKWQDGHGYIMVYLYPDDFFYPMANKNRYVFEHRLVVAKALGRCLLPWETVHHKEGYAKDDNRYPESLELLPSPYKHDALTRMSNYIKQQEKRIQQLKVEIKRLSSQHGIVEK